MIADLVAWWPKLRKGGLLSGDDFLSRDDSILLTQERTKAKFPKSAFMWEPSLSFAWQTKNAIEDFAKANGNLIVRTTFLHDCDDDGRPIPNWWIIKPF